MTFKTLDTFIYLSDLTPLFTVEEVGKKKKKKKQIEEEEEKKEKNKKQEKTNSPGNMRSIKEVMQCVSFERTFVLGVLCTVVRLKPYFHYMVPPQLDSLLTLLAFGTKCISGSCFHYRYKAA